MPLGTARGLAAALAAWDDDALAALLLARPDLARPAPADLVTLAARATSGPSVQQLGLSLTRADLVVARAVAAGTSCDAERLRTLAVVWDEDGTPVLVAPLAGVLDRVPFDGASPEPPSVPVVPVSDDAAGHAASQAVALVDELLRAVSGARPRVLRAGGMPAADVRSLARGLDIDQPVCVLLLEVAQATGLLRETDDDAPLWAPTTGYDEWRVLPAAERWAALAIAWLELRRAPHLVGRPDANGKGTTNALAPEADWAPIRTLREHVLAELATLDGGTTPAALVARLQWRHALVTVPDHADLVQAVLDEATLLGVVAGGLAGPGRALLATRSPEAAASAMAAALPPVAASVRLGADLTAVAAGRLEGDLADLLTTAADIESRGGATVFRFSPASVARALDAGWSGPRLLEALREAAVDDLPQPLVYLVEDAGRRHGALTLGGVSSYLRCDEPSVLAELAAAPRLGLRVVAPTIAVSDLAPTVLLARLRAAGRVPAVEGPDGSVHVVGAAPVRATARRARVQAPPLSAAEARSVVAALRARPASDPGEAREPETMRALLADAVATGAVVHVEYAGAGGAPHTAELAPSAVEAGRVRGTVDGVERVIPLARIALVRT